MATYNGQAVVLKVLRTDAVGDPDLTRKVRALPSHYSDTFSTYHKTGQALAREVVGWKWLRHENILPFIGVTSMSQPFQIVSPWMENGNIVEFLKNHPEQNPFDLVSNRRFSQLFAGSPQARS